MEFKNTVIKQMRLGKFGFEKDAYFDMPMTAMLKKRAWGPGWVLNCGGIGISWIIVTGKNWEEAKQNATAKLLERVYDRLQMYHGLFEELT